MEGQASQAAAIGGGVSKMNWDRAKRNPRGYEQAVLSRKNARQLGAGVDEAIREAMRLEQEVRRERFRDVRRARSKPPRQAVGMHGYFVTLRYGRQVAEGFLTTEEIVGPSRTLRAGVGASDQAPRPSSHPRDVGNAPEVETSSPQTPGPAAPEASMVHAHMQETPTAQSQETLPQKPSPQH